MAIVEDTFPLFVGADVDFVGETMTKHRIWYGIMFFRFSVLVKPERKKLNGTDLINKKSFELQISSFIFLFNSCLCKTKK